MNNPDHYNMKRKTIVTALLWLITGYIIAGTATVKAQSQGPEDSLRVVNRSVMVNKQLGIVHLNEAEHAGIAWITGKAFKAGVIEFDIKGEDKFQASFVGIAYHGVNDTTYESLYFRPFNFLAADPDRKAHGVQYIALPQYDWPKLRADFPNRYEQPMLSAVDPNQWFHVKITVSADLVNVYINGHKKPVLTVKPLVKTGGAMLGYWVGNGSAGDWKNMKITHK